MSGSVNWGVERVTNISWAKESRTVTILEMGNPVVYRQSRSVKLRTKVKKGFSETEPDPSEVDAVDLNPVDNDATTGVKYDCKLAYNPVTGLVTKTTVERVGLAGNAGKTGYWVNESRTASNSGS